MWINETLVERVTDYVWVSFISTVFGFDRDTKTAVLPELLGYYEDTPFRLDSTSSTNPNKAHDKRIKNLLLNGREVELKARLNFGCFEISELLPNHSSVRIVLNRKSPQFPLHYAGTTIPTGANYQLELTFAELEVRRVGPSPTALRDYNAGLAANLSRFDFVKSQCKTFTFVGERSDIIIDNLYNGQIPKLVLVMMVGNDVYHGNIQKTSFNFKDYGFIKGCLKVDGQIFPSPTGYDLNVSENKFTDAFLQLQSCFPARHGVSREQFKGGLFVLAFPLDGKQGQNGQISLNFTFKGVLGETVTLIAIAYHDVHFMMDQTRNISSTYIP